MMRRVIPFIAAALVIPAVTQAKPSWWPTKKAAQEEWKDERDNAKNKGKPDQRQGPGKEEAAQEAPEKGAAPVLPPRLEKDPPRQGDAPDKGDRGRGRETPEERARNARQAEHDAIERADREAAERKKAAIQKREEAQEAARKAGRAGTIKPAEVEERVRQARKQADEEMKRADDEARARKEAARKAVDEADRTIGGKSAAAHDEASGFGKQAEAKAGQVQKGLEQGSQTGQESKADRKAWWRFWE